MKPLNRTIEAVEGFPHRVFRFSDRVRNRHTMIVTREQVAQKRPQRKCNKPKRFQFHGQIQSYVKITVILTTAHVLTLDFQYGLDGALPTIWKEASVASP